MPHSRNEAGAPEECADAEALAAENASLRDRMLRALADAENTRRRAERTVRTSRSFATATTPATRFAALSASYLSASLRTNPVSVTAPLCAVPQYRWH
jgi:hypothetical protein